MAASTVIRTELKPTGRERAVGPGDHGSVAPVLDGRSRAATRLARLTGCVHPARTFFTGIVIAYVAVAGLSILLGLLVTRVLIANGTIAGDDSSVVRVLSHHRSGDRTEASLIGSIIAGGVVLPLLVAGFGWSRALPPVAARRVLDLRARDRVGRVPNDDAPDPPAPSDRGHGSRSLPVNASYPSGHTAASIAVYGGIALLLTSRSREPWAARRDLGRRRRDPDLRRDLRMYRGMHHPLDIAGARSIGVATLVAVVLVCRAAGFAAASRDDKPDRPGASSVSKVAVIAHAGKTFGDGLPELRRELERHGVAEPALVPRSRRAGTPRGRSSARSRPGRRADLRLGRRRARCSAASTRLAGSRRALAILPAGTANLLATNLGIPQDIEQAVEIGLHGERRRLDVGRFNGERFGVMAGAGFDAAMIQQATARSRIASAASPTSGPGRENLRAKPFKPKIEIDGTSWYKRPCQLHPVGNVGHLFGGIEVFEHASPEDGRLEVGVVNADGIVDWARTLARTAAGHPERSPFVRATSARKIDVKLDRKVLYELDGGDRTKVKSFKVRVEPRAVSICVPKRRSPE